jgi:hypothetical protein
MPSRDSRWCIEACFKSAGPVARWLAAVLRVELISILTFALAGSFNLRIRSEDVFSRLCTAYAAHEFEASALCGSAVNWQAASQPYRLIPTYAREGLVSTSA